MISDEASTAPGLEVDGDGTGMQAPVAAAPLVALTSLKSVPITSVWPTEPHHFTPWLLASSALVSELLGIDVELEAREHRVGKFSLDIIGREVSTGARVIIENQFGATDHSHLGQLLTYAGGTKPTVVVWIAEVFREEHRAALDWLNTHTEPGIRFFGVRLAAVTLEGAPPGLIAPALELIVKPNDWEKQAQAVAGTSAGTTPTQELYREFWALFVAEAKARHWTSASPPAQNWINLPTGVGSAVWGVSFATYGCRSELYFGDPDAAVNQHRWGLLAARAEQVRAAFGPGDLIFDDLPNNKACRIETRLIGPKIAEREKWPSIVAWMVDTQERLRNAVAQVGGVPSGAPDPVDVGDVQATSA